MEVDAKIVDLAILATPMTRSNGFRVVAMFTLLCRPFRIADCRLAITPKGTFVFWVPDKSIRIMGWAKDELAETARLAYVDAQKQIAV